MAIRVACRQASCSEAFILPDEHVWQRVSCPACGETLIARPFEFTCSDAACGRFLPYNNETAGKRVKCPDCETVTRAPEPRSASARGTKPTSERLAGVGPDRGGRTKPMRASRGRSRIAHARRPGRPFFVTVLALCVIAAAFAEFALVVDHFYPWHELAEPLGAAEGFSKEILRESSLMLDRQALIAIGAVDLLSILFLVGFLSRSNLMRWLAFLVCLGGAALSGACSEIIPAAGWGALRAATAVFLLLPGTGRWVR